jgi:hypothetical protein
MCRLSTEAVISNFVAYNSGSQIFVSHETAKTAQFSRTDNLFLLALLNQ